MNKLRHRIHEIFSEELLIEIENVKDNPMYTDNNSKIEEILILLKDLGVIFVASGTNRMAILINGYIFKIALDSFGIKDNWNEFEMSTCLQPYVTKTYECNGLIAVAEYVNLINKDEFYDNRDNIASILTILSENYLFCDMGLTTKNYANFGYRATKEIVILDYGYIYPLDDRIMYCKKCGNKLIWNKYFTKLVCSHCAKEHDPIEIRDRMRKVESTYKNVENKKGPIKIVINR